MGEVYRARDPRLGREVAIKVLNEEASSSAERRARFEREARAVAALNHPNVLSVFEFGSSEGRFYIAMELVEGESLRQRMESGALPVKDVYRLAVQIADGMAAAHAAGITHRDLKPENIMLTGDGRAKILDFGLARQAPKGASKAASGDDVTRTQLDTEPGRVMGTVGYMSPEQVRGVAADHRSDQFSFGAILYEMVSGQRPFSGDSSVEAMNAILKEEPRALDVKMPAPLRWTIARCLEKDPAARYESTGDLYRELRGQQEHLSDMFTSTDVAAPGTAAASRSRRPWLWAGMIAAVLLAAAAGVWWGRHASPPAVPMRFSPMEVVWGNADGAKWSPDGKAFAYSANVDGVRQVFLRYLNSHSPVQLTHGSARSCLAGWSTDGKRVLTVPCDANGQTLHIYSVPIFGGEPEEVGSVPDPDTLDIRAGRIAVVTHENGMVIVKTGALGTELKRYAPGPFESTSHLNLPRIQFSPDGSNLLLFLDVPKARSVWMLPVPDGREQPRRVLTDLPGYGGTPEFSWMPDGRHIVLSMPNTYFEKEHLWYADLASGERRRITNGTSTETSPAVSPDGKMLLFTQSRTEYTLMSVSLQNAEAKRILTSDLQVGMPAWAMRQEKFAYTTNRSGAAEIWLRGGGSERPLVTQDMFPAGSTAGFMVPALSPDADRLVYPRVDSQIGALIWISSVSGGPPVRLTNESGYVEFGGSWSPDGRSFVFLRCKGSACETAIAKTSGEASPARLCDAVYAIPQWSPDGRWIKFLAPGHSGWTLISPDGKDVRAIGMNEAVELTFSLDSKTLYGFRPDAGRAQLFSLDLASKAVKPIGYVDNDEYPASLQGPGIRLSLSPDGKSILYPAVRGNRSLWMLEGF